ncbi:MAG: VWA domain-containing protein [Archangiaceae bacterium]|nr:VWA domain-containing protein [Archangiaceae bacterium]
MSARTLVASLLLLACGKAYVNPVSIDAKAEPPVVMVLFDKSGSTASPLNPTGACAGCQFPGCNETQCPTRLGTERAWVGRLLNALGDRARWGLTVFPADPACTPAGSGEVLLTPSTAVGAGQLVAQLNGVAPVGGTPTAASLGFVGQALPSDTAERIVLLVTDGVPNCNPDNENTCLDPMKCECTLVPAQCASTLSTNDTNFCIRGCTDAAAAEQAVRTLATHDAFTLVVGFGTDFVTPAANPLVLDAMAQASLDGQWCNTDHDCFGYTCQSGTCRGGAVLASDGDGLDQATSKLTKKLQVSSRCRWSLAVPLPTGPDSIYFGSQQVPAGDVHVETPSRVRFLGESCRRLVEEQLTPTFYGKP